MTWCNLISALIACHLFFSQHRESVKDPVSSAHHPRYRGRGDRLLSRPRPVRALPQGRGAPLGGGSRSQRHWALQSVPGEATALHQPGPGCTARLRNKTSASLRFVWMRRCACVRVSQWGNVSMIQKYGWETDLQWMCDFGHICVSLKQHTFLGYFFNSTLVEITSCFSGENVF